MFAVVFSVTTTFALAALALPENFEHYLNLVKALEIPSMILFSGKTVLAWPLCYHAFNGIRHLVGLLYFLLMLFIYHTTSAMLLYGNLMKYCTSGLIFQYSCKPFEKCVDKKSISSLNGTFQAHYMQIPVILIADNGFGQKLICFFFLNILLFYNLEYFMNTSVVFYTHWGLL